MSYTVRVFVHSHELSFLFVLTLSSMFLAGVHTVIHAIPTVLHMLSHTIFYAVVTDVIDALMEIV